MILKNPTDSTVSIVYKGTQYSIAPQDSVTVPEEVGRHWMDRVHQFLEEVFGEESAADAPVETQPEPEADEVDADDADSADAGDE